MTGNMGMFHVTRRSFVEAGTDNALTLKDVAEGEPAGDGIVIVANSREQALWFLNALAEASEGAMFTDDNRRDTEGAALNTS